MFARIIAVSSDTAVREQLAAALNATGFAVEAHRTLASIGPDALHSALWVVHFDGELASAEHSILPHLDADCRVIAVLPRSSLASIVDLMQASDHVVGMVIAEDLDARELTAMATRVVTSNIFGIHHVMAPGTRIHTLLISDYRKRYRYYSKIMGFAAANGIPRKQFPSIEQCVDEMLMNAIYDAPVDDQGNGIYAGIPTNTRVTMKIPQTAVVQYACDGRQFAVSVRDAYGSLDRQTVLRFLHKGLHAEEKVDRKAGGAGLGLYLMVNAATSVHFNVVPGVATEALCVFDLQAPKFQLETFGVFVEPTDVTGALVTARLPPGAVTPVVRREPLSRTLVAILGVTLAAIVVIGIAAWPRLFPHIKKAHVTVTTNPAGATIEIEGRAAGTTASGSLSVDDLEVSHAYRVVARLAGYQPSETVVTTQDGANAVAITLQLLPATVDLDSQPTGATIVIDGKPMGETPLTLTSLVPGATVAIVFKRVGYHDATAQLHVPKRGEQAHLVQPLAVSDQFVTVHFESTPSGAQVLQDDKAINNGTYTPADVVVEANKELHFSLKLYGRLTFKIDPFTAHVGETGLTKKGELAKDPNQKTEDP